MPTVTRRGSRSPASRLSDIDLDDVVLHFVDGDLDGRGALDGIDRQADGTTHAQISVSVDPTS